MKGFIRRGGFRRAVAMILALIMCIIQFPVEGLAADYDSAQEDLSYLEYEIDSHTILHAERRAEDGTFSEGDYLELETKEDADSGMTFYTPEILSSDSTSAGLTDIIYSIQLTDPILMDSLDREELSPVIYQRIEDLEISRIEDEKINIDKDEEKGYIITIDSNVVSFAVDFVETSDDTYEDETSPETSDDIASDTDAAGEDEDIPSEQGMDEATDTDASAEALPASTPGSMRRMKAMAPLGASPEDEFTDYTDYLTSHKIIIDNNTMKGDGTETIDPSKDFGLSLEFQLFYADMTKDGVKFKFQMPEHITIGDKGSADNQLTLYDGSGIAIGTYYIKDDVIYVTYPGYYYDCTTRFNLDASWDDIDNVNEVNVQWKDKTDIFKIDNTSIYADKTADKYTTVNDSGSDYLYETYFKVTATAKEKDGARTLTDLELKDTMKGTKMEFIDGRFTDESGASKDFMVVRYSKDNTIISTTYYNKNDSNVTFDATTGSDSKTTTTFTISGLELDPGEHVTVYYYGGIKKDKEMLVMAEGDSYENKAEFSYPYTNPKTGENEKQTVSATDTGNKPNSPDWLFKNAPEKSDMHFVTIDEDMKTVAKYEVGLNSGLTENVGGSSINDKIEMSDGDRSKGYTIGYYAYDSESLGEGSTYKYNSAAFKPSVTAKDSDGNTSTEDINFKMVSEATYNRIKAYHASGDSLQLDAFLADTALINQIKVETGVEITTDNAYKYIFVYDGSDEFVWFAPKSDVNTAYTLTYYSCADAAVSQYKNGASFWFKTTFSTEPGDAIPVIVNFASSKHNGGTVRKEKVGDSYQYFVDYTITFAMGEGSAGLYDYNITDWFPSYDMTCNDNNVKVYDWLYGLNESSISMADTDGSSNAAALRSCFTITTDSDREDVKTLVNQITVANQKIEWIDLKGEPYNNIRNDSTDGLLNQLLARELSKPESILHTTYKYENGGRTPITNVGIYPKGSDGADLQGQFASTASIGESDGVTAINEGDRFSLGGVVFFVGDLPDTLGKDPYEINITYTMQVNPYLIEHLEDQLVEEDKTELKLNNTAKWFSEYGYNERNLHTDAIGTGRGSALSSYYTIGANIPADVINKKLTKGYDADDDSMTYEIDVNKEQDLVAIKQKYLLTDNVSMVGVKYMPGTLEVKDEGGKIVYTEISGHSVDELYSGLTTYERTDNDNESNSFKLQLDNTTEAFTGENSKFKHLIVSYKLDVSEVKDATSYLSNTAKLSVWEPTAGNVTEHWKDLSSSSTSSSIAKALDKVLVKAPSADTDYKAQYKITVDPKSPNSEELGELAASASVSSPKEFVLEDTFDSSLSLDLDSVKVYQVLDGTQTDITETSNASYDSRNRIFKLSVQMTDPDATYLITYDAQTTGVEINKLATISNTAKITGTGITEEKTEDQVYIYKFNGDASASALRIKLCKYDEVDITKRLKATFDLYRYNFTETEENRENSINTPKATTDAGSWGKVEVTEPLTTDVTTGEIELKNDVVGSTTDQQVEYDTWYKLTETEAPAGYAAAAPYYYYVMGDGRNADKIPEDAKGKFSVIIPAKAMTDEAPVIYIGNGGLRLTVLKEDASSKDPLEGATFGLYSEASCAAASLIKSGTTNEDGLLIFEGDEMASVSYPGSVYMKETTQPTGYKKNNKVYKITLDELGNITSVANNADSSDTLAFDPDLARITVPNEYNYAYLSISKDVEPANARSDAGFSFVINLSDKSSGANVTKKYAANKIAADGTVTAEANGYISGTVVTLKHGETFEIPKIDRDVTYTVTETRDANFKTAYAVEKISGNDTTSDSGDGTTMTGGVDKGEIARVTFTNTRQTSILVQKDISRADGVSIEIPVGHTITARSSWDGGTIYATAVWNGSKYVSTYVNSDLGIVFSTTGADGEEIDQGFRLTGMPIARTDRVYLVESGADVSGLIYKLDDADGANPNEIRLTDRLTGTDRVGILKNTYYQPDASASLAVKKNMVGRDLVDGEFKFQLRMKYHENYGEYGYISKEVENDEYGNVNFGAIGYSLDDLKVTDQDTGEVSYPDKTFYYRIQENTDNASSHSEITYDTKFIYAKVTLSVADDNGTPRMSATEPEYYDIDPERLSAAELEEHKLTGDEVSFTNAYTAEGEVSIKAYKSVTGRSANADKFGFKIVEYTNEEYDTPIDGNEADSIVSSASNTAIDNGETGEISFSPIKYKLTSDRSSGETNEDSVLGYHYYLVSEKIPEGAENGEYQGWKYDSSSYKLKVYVSDAGDGKLDATIYDSTGNVVTADELAGDISFDNEYDATGKLNMYAFKYLTGRSMTASDSFDFKVDELELSEGSMPDTWTVKKGDVASGTSVTIPNNTLQVATLSDIDYTLEDAGKTFYYKVSEVVPGGAVDNQLSGITYSDAVYYAIVYIGDTGQGILNPLVNYYNESFEPIVIGRDGFYMGGSVYGPVFTNTYHASGSVTFKLDKELIGRNLADIDNFTFSVDRIDASGAIEERGVSTGSMSGFAGKTKSEITFTPIEYDETDVGKTYYYRITEDIPDDASDNTLDGVTYTTTPVKATVTVGDDGEGNIITNVTYEEESIFKNLYKAGGSLTLKADKLLDRADIKDGQFTFELLEGDDVIATATNDADGNIVFDTLVYDLDDLGSKTYIIREAIPEDAQFEDGAYAYEYDDLSGWMTYDEASYTIKVDISDNQNGTLGIIVDGATLDEDDGCYAVDYDTEDNTRQAAFVNTYSERKDIDITLKGTKTLQNNDLYVSGPLKLEGLFSFTITEVTEDGNHKVGSGKTDKDGNIIYDKITYSWKDIGAHKYIITEDSTSRVPGVIYDSRAVNVDVIVSDNGDGSMSAEVEYIDAGVVKKDASFTNKATEVRFRKTDEGGNDLENAIIAIKKTDGTKVVQYRSDGKVKTVYGLEQGCDYIMTELEAPSGYEVADSITFHVGNDGKTYVDGKEVDLVRMMDSRVTTDTETNKRTGDNTSLGLIALLMLISMMGAGLIILRKKRKIMTIF